MTARKGKVGYCPCCGWKIQNRGRTPTAYCRNKKCIIRYVWIEHRVATPKILMMLIPEKLYDKPRRWGENK